MDLRRSTTMENNWRNKTIEALEKRDFGNPAEAPTPLTKRCLELSKKPLNEFSAEELSLMIGQGFSLNYLIPLAIDFLKKDLLTEGDLYPGDLLKSVQSVDEAFWVSNPKLRKELDGWIDGKRKPISESLQSRIKFL